MAARVAVGGEHLNQMSTVEVVHDQHQYQRELGVQPAAAESITQPQPDAEK